MSITVSIIMPVYNCESYIQDQMISLLRQTHKNFELIIIDDGSTDNTLPIINEFRKMDDRISLYSNENKKGISGALNTGIKYASGKYIARADGDDINIENRIELQYEFLEKNKEIGIVGTFSTLFNEKGIIGISKYPTNTLDICWHFISNTYFSHPTVMFRSEIIAKVGIYPDIICEDFSFFSRAIKKIQAVNLPVSLIRYRVHSSSLSHANPIKMTHYVKIQSMENYRYYTNSGKLENIFTNFQRSKSITIKYFFQVILINSKIIKKIRSDYSISFFSKTNFIFLINQFVFFIYALCPSYLKKLIRIIINIKPITIHISKKYFKKLFFILIL